MAETKRGRPASKKKEQVAPETKKQAEVDMLREALIQARSEIEALKVANRSGGGERLIMKNTG
jgi:hypothetical protein